MCQWLNSRILTCRPGDSDSISFRHTIPLEKHDFLQATVVKLHCPDEHLLRILCLLTGVLCGKHMRNCLEIYTIKNGEGIREDFCLWLSDRALFCLNVCQGFDFLPAHMVNMVEQHELVLLTS